MTTPHSPTPSLIDTLKDLSSPSSPLHATLQKLREVARQIDPDISDDTLESFRHVERDLAAVQAGSKRMVEQIEMLQGLVRTSALMTSTLDVHKVLEEVMDTAIMLTDAERAFLVLRQDGSEELELRAARNWDRETLKENDITFSRSVIDTALKTGEPILTLNAQGDSRFQNNQSVLVNQLRSILCIPLKLRERVIGVLYADNRLEQGVFDQDSVALLTSFANQAAIAIINAQQFARINADLAEAKRKVRRLEIEVNEQRLKSEISEITDTDYFQRLSELAHDLRKKNNRNS